MNSAYLSRLYRTALTVLSEVPSVSPPFDIRDALHPALQNDCSGSCTRQLHGHASSVTGGSDPTKLLGGWTAKKWGRYRPIWSFFFCDFSIRDVAYPSPFLTATCFMA